MLREARSLFAERGFYGVSIAQVTAELGLTKQALLHHFGTKERLYGLVLEQIAEEFASQKSALNLPGDPAMALSKYLASMVALAPSEIERSRVLMREILDNRIRAETAGRWYLKPFLEDLVEMLRSVPTWSKADDGERLAAIVQMLGAINYHAVSRPTFRGIFGEAQVQAMDASFKSELQALVAGVLEQGPR